MKKISYFLHVIIGITLLSCSTGSGNDDTTENYKLTAEGSSVAPQAAYDNYNYEAEESSEYDYGEYNKNSDTKKDETGKVIPVSSQMLIKTGNIGFETGDVYQTREKVNSLVKQYNAYVSSESEDYYGSKINQYLTIRIPNKYFESFVDALCDGIEHFDNKNIYVQDVTEEFVDTETRIANKKALEQKYITLLEKAHTIEDILEIEKEINYLREEIELAEAHLKNLSAQISYSTLDLYIYERTSEESHAEEPENRFILGLKGGWDAVIDFFVDLTYAWPAMLIIVVLFFILRSAWKKKFKPMLFGRD